MMAAKLEESSSTTAVKGLKGALRNCAMMILVSLRLSVVERPQVRKLLLCNSFWS